MQKEGRGLHAGIGAANTLDITARGSHFAVALNGRSVGSFDDTTFAVGDTGVTGNEGCEAVFTNLTITALR